jgi:hypothetical protein
MLGSAPNSLRCQCLLPAFAGVLTRDFSGGDGVTVSDTMFYLIIIIIIIIIIVIIIIIIIIFGYD